MQKKEEEEDEILQGVIIHENRRGVCCTWMADTLTCLFILLLGFTSGIAFKTFLMD